MHPGTSVLGKRKARTPTNRIRLPPHIVLRSIRSRFAAGYDITFLHPNASDEFPIAGEGVLIELVQAPPEVIAALG